MAYAEWLIIEIHPTNFDVFIKNTAVVNGKLYLGAKDNEVAVTTLNDTVIRAGERFQIGACGRSDETCGSEGSFDLFDVATGNRAGRYEWDCPYWPTSQNKSEFNVGPGFDFDFHPGDRRGFFSSPPIGAVSISLTCNQASGNQPAPNAKAHVSLVAYNTHLFEDTLVGRGTALAGAINSTMNSQLERDAERRLAIVQRVRETGPDVIGFSEVWSAGVQDEVMTSLNQGQGYQCYAFQGHSIRDKKLFGAGMVLATQGKMGPSGFDYFTDLVDTDKLSAKGVTFSLVTIKEVTCMVVQTHAQASYEGKREGCDQARITSLDRTLFPRLSQLMSHFNGPVFLLGDLNIVASEASASEYQGFVAKMRDVGMEDAWTALYPQESDLGCTYDPDANSLVKRFDPQEHAKQRLDYIFYRKSHATVVSAEVLKWKTPGESGIDVSDHYGLRVDFEV